MINFLNGHLFLLVCSKFCCLEENLINFKNFFLTNENIKDRNYFQTRLFKKIYLDDYFLDGNLGTGKEKVVELFQKLAYPAAELIGWKFYTIYNFDKLNNFCYNSILKFIENPPSKTVGFLVTKSSSKIPKTVKSRAQEIIMKPCRVDLTKYCDEKNEIDQRLLEKVFDSIDEIQKFYNSKNLNFIKELFLKIKKLKINEENIFEELNKFKVLSEDEIRILLKFLYKSDFNWKKENIYKIIVGCNVNVNKTLLFNKIINLG